ncbi:MAG TPA: peptidoglycan bridge formation glycyltransferase FemA/FemB family protein [Patescibacteria group bacterium]
MSEVRILTQSDKNQYDKVANHIIQSWEWGEFRQNEGKKVVRIGEFKDKKLISVCQITFHKIPKTNFSIGYAPKTKELSGQFLDFLKVQATKEKAVFIKFEPDLIEVPKSFSNLKKSSKTIFAPNTFLLDLTKNDQDLLSNMHQKTRYNINLAARKGIVVEEKNDLKSFETFLKLQRETANRQGFYIHPDSYYKLLWRILKPKGMVHLLVARYKKTPLVTWILFRFKDMIYYPYGGSSLEYKNLMAPNLIAWESILFGKKIGCKMFDFWGALNESPDPKDPWYGFHRFKAGYGGKLVTYIGAYDLVISPLLYDLFVLGDKLRWLILRVKRS